MPTIQDIATKAGVAKSTVSRYLNGGSVSSKTARKIEAIIQKENYKPSPFAQSLKAKSSMIIGVIIPRVDSLATAHTLMGIEAYATSLGYELLIANAWQDNEREIQAIQQFVRYKVAGIILLATELTDQHVQTLQAMSIPVMIVGQEHSAFHCVIHDDYQAGYQLAKQLIQHGHHSLTYVGVSARDHAVGIRRKEGVCAAAKEAPVALEVLEGDFTIQTAIQMGQTLFQQKIPRLVIAATDNLAIGFMKAAHQQGLHIPKKIALAGFGGYEIGELVTPTLSTVKYQFHEAGRVAMEKLACLLKEEPCERQTIIPVTVQLRESTLID